LWGMAMPELPDVEVARRRLDHALRGATITRAHSADRRILRPKSPSALSRATEGRTVRDVSRRGKWLKVLLDDGGRLFSHLGMTGWWVERDANAPTERSERARIDVVREDGRNASVRYLDSRRFGRLIVADRDIDEWNTLGPDPLADGIDATALAATLAKSRRAIKDVIMDQTILAGVRNIVATEALWHARIDPRSRSNALTRADVSKLVRGLGKAIGEELDVRMAAGTDQWSDVFAVYGHTGQPCPRCGSTIARVVIGGRSTAFCKTCQVRRGAPAKTARSRSKKRAI
jgi:formamidopyrimidine-DNA glycosylase